MVFQQLNFVLVTSILFPLATFAVGLRFYVRVGMIKTFGLDDILLLLTYLTFGVLCGLIMSGPILQNDYADEPIFELLPTIGVITISSQIIYRVAQIFLKLTLGAFFLRVVTRPWQRWTITISVAFYTMYGVAYAFVLLFQCGKPTPTMLFFREPQCLSNNVLFPLAYVSAISNSLTDWIMVAAPLLVISSLQVSKKERASVYFLILLGVLGSVVSIVRIPWVTTEEMMSDKTKTLAVLSVIEPGVGIIAVSLAALRPLFAKMSEYARGSSDNSTLAVREISKMQQDRSARSAQKSIDKDDDLRYLGVAFEGKILKHHDDDFTSPNSPV